MKTPRKRRKNIFLIACAAALANIDCSAGTPATPASRNDNSPSAGAGRLRIWDDRAAETWEVSYPVGNGRLGAMPQGTFPEERILLNEETIWHRDPPDRFLMPEDSHAQLETIRELEAAGKYAEATEYLDRTLLQRRVNPNSYQLLGWLHLDYESSSPLKSTRRELDLQTGIARNRYELEDGTVILQQVFASAPDDVIAVGVSANRPISLRVSFDQAGATEDGDLVKRGGATGREATRYLGRVRGGTDGKLVAADGVLRVTDAREAHFYLAAATDSNRSNPRAKLSAGWEDKALQTLDRVTRDKFSRVLEKAVADHRSYFDRVTLDLGPSPDDVVARPTRERLQGIREGQSDPDLIAAYFQFGRYLLIASSRPGTLPANLQGIWNPHMQAKWSSDFHLNINLQMNYWPAETTNLSELHRPLFDLIALFQPTGREMARRMGMRGWCMPHSTDMWGHAHLMGSQARWAGSFVSGQWLLQHILEHYRFNRDPEVLERNWDILTASTEFVISWLIPGPEEGMLMARPSSSPENTFIYRNHEGEAVKASIAAGNSYDQFMVLQTFHDYLEAADALGKQDTPLAKTVREMLPKVFRPQIGPDGRLMEWRLPFEEAEPGHRHISHLIGAYPGDQIDLDGDQAMRSAVVNTLAYRLNRGGAGTGWSRAWTIGMFARLSDAAEAYQNLIAILQKSTLDNLWDNHPPFQIDGNFGSTAAIAEMLLHSHKGRIKLLPALPEEWPAGRVSGLRARGDLTLDIEWADRRLTKAVITAGPNARPGPLAIEYQDRRAQFDIQPSGRQTLTAADFL